MKSNMQNRALVVKKSTKNATKNNFENSARQKVVLIGKRDLEKNSIISRTTKGGFKQAKKQQVQIFDPNAMVSKQNWKAPKKIELDEEEYFDTLEKIIQRDFFPNLYRETDGLGDTKSEFGEAYKKSQTKLNLNEFLRRYSSEDNIAFEDLQEKDRQKFIKRISWMYDESAKFNKINKLALEYGHKNQVQSGRPNFLLSSAEAVDQVGSNNTRSIPELGYYGKSDPMSSLFFNTGQGNFENQKMLVSEEDHEQKRVIKENTRFDDEFKQKQQVIENKILNPHSRFQNQQNLRIDEFKAPKPKYKVQGIKAREAIGLYLADNTVTAKKKREAKLQDKGSKYLEGSENSQSLQQRAPGQNLISNFTSNQSERSFKTQLSRASKMSRLSQGSIKSTTSIRNQISSMSTSGQNLLKNVMKKRMPDTMSQF